MDVILLERIEKLGRIGDVVKVKDGFARNYLFPQEKALRATDANKKFFEAQRAQIEARNEETKRDAAAAAGRLDGQGFTLIRQASDAGMLYGSVSTRDISEAAAADGFEIARNQVKLDRPLKTLGLHDVRIILHPEVSSTVTINIARSEDEAERQARGENILETAREEDAREAEEAASDIDSYDENADDESRDAAPREEPENTD